MSKREKKVHPESVLPRHQEPHVAQQAPAVSSGPSAPALFLEPLKSSVYFLPSPCTRHPPEAPPWAQVPSWGRFCVATPPPQMAGDGERWGAGSGGHFLLFGVGLREQFHELFH